MTKFEKAMLYNDPKEDKHISSNTSSAECSRVVATAWTFFRSEIIVNFFRGEGDHKKV